MASTQLDKFANYAIVSVTESGANTLTFKKLETGISLTEKVAWIISRIEYFIGTFSKAAFADSEDALVYGLSLSNTFASATLSETTIIDLNSLIYHEDAAPTSYTFDRQPYIKKFSDMPSGGIIVPPTPLYLFAQGVGLGAANSVVARIHYTLLPLAVDQYWELVEARRVLSS